MLVFYPVDFSPVCTDQLSIYQEVLAEIEAKGATLVGVSVDSHLDPQGVPREARPRHPAARRLPSQGRGARAPTAPTCEDCGHRQPLAGPGRRGGHRRAGSTSRPTPLEIPGANLIFDALAERLATALARRLAGMSELTSARCRRRGRDDHVRGEGPELIVYADLGCPHCAASWERIARAAACGSSSATSRSPASIPAHRPCTPPPRRRGARAPSSRWSTRSTPTAAHVDDPHLWERVAALGLDLERFEARPPLGAVAARVRRDFEPGSGPGVAETPALFGDGELARACTLDADREREF